MKLQNTVITIVFENSMSIVYFDVFGIFDTVRFSNSIIINFITDISVHSTQKVYLSI